MRTRKGRLEVSARAVITHGDAFCFNVHMPDLIQSCCAGDSARELPAGSLFVYELTFPRIRRFRMLNLPSCDRAFGLADGECRSCGGDSFARRRASKIGVTEQDDVEDEKNNAGRKQDTRNQFYTADNSSNQYVFPRLIPCESKEEENLILFGMCLWQKKKERKITELRLEFHFVRIFSPQGWTRGCFYFSRRG